MQKQIGLLPLTIKSPNDAEARTETVAVAVNGVSPKTYNDSDSNCFYTWIAFIG